MKTFILNLLLFFTVLSVNAQAVNNDGTQLNQKKEEKIQALYVAYISQQLSLTPAEAEKFWPAHAQYDAELQAINQGSLNELDRQQAVLNVKKKYLPNFNRILGNDRSNNFIRQDAEFRKKLVERLKQIRQQRSDNNNGIKNNANGGRFQRGGRLRP
ncbi:MAG: hypothetical protein ACKVOM_12955 [Ferruginibacter sp.]